MRSLGEAGFRLCPLCGGVVAASVVRIFRHLAGSHRPGEVVAWVTRGGRSG